MTDIARAPRTGCECATVCLLLMCLIALAGCRSATWRAPRYAQPQHRVAPPFPPVTDKPQYPLGSATSDWCRVGLEPLAAAEASYSRGCQLENDGRAECVDEYYRAAVACWPIVEQDIVAGGPSRSLERAWELYHSSLAKVIAAGQAFGRLDPRRGLTVLGQGGAAMVAVRHVGSPWGPEDFTDLIVVGDYFQRRLTNYHRRRGFGVPVVVRSANKDPHQFLRPHQVFAATALLRTGNDTSCHPADAGMPNVVSLDLVDPLRVTSVHAGGIPFPLASDITAPFAYRMTPRDRNPVRGFLQRGYSTAETGLYMVEPYQPGKIPLVFVHGLLSDPLTWADLANELRARPDIIARYQLWAIEYPTGQPFLRSAATLRQDLQTIRHQLDPLCQDGALDQMVLIGHSLGGLVSKLQVTASGTALWDAIANQPLEQIRTDARTKRDLTQLFFFQPAPMVKRVIFIGTPHRGSAWAGRCIGRLGARLVSAPTEERDAHLQLVEDNPDAFAPQVRRGVPTSVELLRPDSRLLQAMESLPVSRDVQLHSIIGTGHRMIGSGPADGVVPVTSARHTGVSETFVDALHEGLHRHPESVAEVIRILRSHAAVCVPF